MTTGGWSDVLEEAIRAMASTDAVRAEELFRRLEGSAGSYVGYQARSLSSAWEPFLQLLKRRGYFVNHPAETRTSLEEIRAMGPGFDLYDLALSLSRCDAALASHLNTPASKVFPELHPFLRPSS